MHQCRARFKKNQIEQNKIKERSKKKKKQFRTVQHPRDNKVDNFYKYINNS